MLNEEQVKKKSIKYKETQNNGRKKYQMIIDYEELEKGKDYFSYSVWTILPFDYISFRFIILLLS